MKLQVTRTFEKMLDAYNDSQYRQIVMYGGSRAGKSWAILQLFVYLLLSRKNLRITVWRNEQTTCRSTVMQDFKNILYSDKFLLDAFTENKARAEFVAKETGSHIVFTGADSISKVLGMTQNISMFNEVSEFSKDVYLQITQRTSEKIFCDYNPSRSFWLDKYRNDPRTKYLQFTYKDNAFCPPEIVNQLLSYDPSNPDNVKNGTANEWMHRVYTLGELAERPNRIYKNWRQCTDQHFESQPYTSYWGLDFGISSPTALVELKYDGDRTFFVRERLYRPISTMNKPLYEYLRDNIRGLTSDSLIVADSAKKTMIQDLIQGGLLAVGALKGAGSVQRNFSTVQSFTVVYTQSSKNLNEEYHSYSYKVDRYGLTTDEEDKSTPNHLLDALAYAITYLVKYLDIRVK